MNEKRELDEKVAISRGCETIWLGDGDSADVFRILKDSDCLHPYGNIPHFSTDIADAFLLVDEIAPHTGFVLKLDWHGPEVAGSGYAWASFSGFEPKFGAHASTEAEAICRAYLKWRGGK